MKISNLLLFISIIAFSSCSTIYQNGQTPDDVYYSPTRAVGHNYRTEARTSNYEEREIRMSAYDPRWRNLDVYYNYDYSYSPYYFGYDYGYYYNPYYYPCPVYISGVAISNPVNTVPRMANLRTYTSTTPVITNQKTIGSYQVNSRKAYTNSNSSNTGSFIRRLLSSGQNNSYNNNNNNNNRTYENNNRTYTPSSNNSSNSSGNSGGSRSSGSVPRPSRGGN